MKGYRTVDKKSPILGPLKDNYELFDLLDALKEEIFKYEWSVSDYEFFMMGGFIPDIREISSNKLFWISGENLYKLSKSITCTNWGAFLAYFPNEAPFEYIDPPFSEGRPRCIQHQKAIIEIQAVDGGYFEIFSKDFNVYNLLKTHFQVEEVNSLETDI